MGYPDIYIKKHKTIDKKRFNVGESFSSSLVYYLFFLIQVTVSFSKVYAFSTLRNSFPIGELCDETNLSSRRFIIRKPDIRNIFALFKKEGAPQIKLILQALFLFKKETK